MRGACLELGCTYVPRVSILAAVQPSANIAQVAATRTITLDNCFSGLYPLFARIREYCSDACAALVSC